MCYFAISQIIILFVKDWLQPIPFHHLHPKSYLHCTKIIFILLETPTSILPTKSTLLILEVRITSFAVSALGSLFFYVRKLYVIFTALPCFSQRFIKEKNLLLWIFWMMKCTLKFHNGCLRQNLWVSHMGIVVTSILLAKYMWTPGLQHWCDNTVPSFSIGLRKWLCLALLSHILAYAA